jgi:RimJ/RimL family protein N-acetyltransferase
MSFPDDVPTLSNGDVTLRAHRLDDIDGIVAQCTDPVSLRWTTVQPGYTAEMGRSFVTERVPAGWHSGESWAFAIESTHPDGQRRFSGTVSLRDEGARRAEIAFGAHPAIRGRGVTTTAVNLLLDWGFDHRDLETVIWLAERGNLGSRRVAWKTGFSFGGVLPHWLNHGYRFPDAWVATLHRDDPREPTQTWYDVPVLDGESVVLRPQRLDDADRIVEGCSDATTRYWLPSLPSPYTYDDARAYIEAGAEAAAEGDHLQWAIADARTDELLGVIGMPRMHRTSAEVGYWTHPGARRRGVMTEALSLLKRHAFTATERGGMGIRRLFVKAAEGNVASQRVALANGFTRYGVERRAEALGDGTFVDKALFDLLSEEWEG